MTDQSRGRPQLGAVLCTFRRPECVAAMLRSIESQTKSIDVLVVVDNGRDPLVERMCTKPGTSFRIRYLAPDTNIGPAGGFHVGITSLLVELDANDLVVLLDDDDPPRRSDTFERLYRVACSLLDDPTFAGVGVRGGRLRNGRIARVPAPDGPAVQECDHLHGGFQPTYRIAACRDVTPFDPDFFWGFEELEFGRRLCGAGWRLFAAAEPGDPIASKRPGGARRLVRPTWRDYYRHRNLLAVLRRERDFLGIGYTVALRLIGKPLAFMVVRPTLAVANLSINARAIVDSLRRPLPDRRDFLRSRA